MKPNFILLLSCCAVLLMFSACKNDDVITGIKIDSPTCALGISEEKQLTAAAFPSDKNRELITWSSSNSEVASVDVNGLVLGQSKGEAVIYATLGSFVDECKVTVIERHELPVSLTGSDYFLISMDNYSSAAIADKLIADYRPNGMLNNMFIWRDTVHNVDTYLPGTYEGLNAYGEQKPWVSLIENNAGWSGARFYTSDVSELGKLDQITSHIADYTLHIAIRDTTNTVYMFGLFDDNKYRFAVGASAFNDRGDIIPAIAEFARDGEWHELNIPMSTFASAGFKYVPEKGGINVFWILSGNKPGSKVEIDAVFIYKKPI